MRHELQKAIRRELSERVPRGLSGGPQNQLRFAISLFLSQKLSFEDSLEKALAIVRGRHPEFVPMILPPAA